MHFRLRLAGRLEDEPTASAVDDSGRVLEVPHKTVVILMVWKLSLSPILFPIPHREIHQLGHCCPCNEGDQEMICRHHANHNHSLNETTENFEFKHKEYCHKIDNGCSERV